jgi:hypothetical protein
MIEPKTERTGAVKPLRGYNPSCKTQRRKAKS